jgi:hypothetical protein
MKNQDGSAPLMIFWFNVVKWHDWSSNPIFFAAVCEDGMNAAYL